jgi:nucleoside-diphosphate-sugar epimerase
MSNSIFIWGMGWLGIPLAHKFLSEKIPITALTRSQDKKEQLILDGIEAITLFDLKERVEILTTCQTCIYLVPPKKDMDFLNHLDYVLLNLPDNANFIYTSSTGIYQNKNGMVDENADLDESSDVFFIERFIRDRKPNCTILRLGGLIGPNRHPVHFLTKKAVNLNPSQVVNLVQQADVIEILFRMILNPNIGIYNFCSEEHPTRKNYYNQAANAFGLSELSFEKSNSESGKIIDSKKIRQIYHFNEMTSIYNFDLCK